MGFFSNLVNAFTGDDSAKAVRRASSAVSVGELERAGILAEGATRAGNIAADYSRAGMDASLNFLAPYAERGQQYGSLLGRLLGLSGPDEARAAWQEFETAPGFQEAVDYGSNQAMQRGINFGGLRSGATLKALQGVGQRSAYQAGQNWLRQLGQGAAAGRSIAGQQANYANTGYANVGNALSRGALGSAEARGAGVLGSAQAKAGGVVGAQEARNQAASNVLGFGGSLLRAYMGAPGGGGDAWVAPAQTGANLPWQQGNNVNWLTRVNYAA